MPRWCQPSSKLPRTDETRWSAHIFPRFVVASSPFVPPAIQLPTEGQAINGRYTSAHGFNLKGTVVPISFRHNRRVYMLSSPEDSAYLWRMASSYATGLDIRKNSLPRGPLGRVANKVLAGLHV